MFFSRPPSDPRPAKLSATGFPTDFNRFMHVIRCLAYSQQYKDNVDLVHSVIPDLAEL